MQCRIYRAKYVGITGSARAKSVGPTSLFEHESDVYGRDVRRWIHVPRDDAPQMRATGSKCRGHVAG